MLAATASTAVIWALELGGYYYIGLAVDRNFTIQRSVLFLAVVNFASIIPLSGGGIGTIEMVTPSFLISSGVPASAALAMVLLQHAAQYLFTTVSGGILYMAGRFYRIPLSLSAPSVEAGPASSALVETKASVDELRADVTLRPAARHEIELSIVIQAYNEEKRLPRTALQTLRWCAERNFEFEIVIVDDGSRDQTLALARVLEESDARIRVLACPHRGKGADVRMGMLNAHGSYRLFMDADGATPLDEIPKLLAAVQEGDDIAIGSRARQELGEVEVRRSFGRWLVSCVFSFFVNVFAIRGIADTQCGFKMFRREAATAVFSQQKLDGFAFDVEILFVAKRLLLAVCEIPVNWVAQPGSKVNLLANSLRMLWDICHVRWVHLDLGQSPGDLLSDNNHVPHYTISRTEA